MRDGTPGTIKGRRELGKLKNSFHVMLVIKALFRHTLYEILAKSAKTAPRTPRYNMVL
jgi:hypothetical protein